MSTSDNNKTRTLLDKSSRSKSCCIRSGSDHGTVSHIAMLNDAAIYKWAIDNDRTAAQALLTQALDRVNSFSRTLLSQPRKTASHHQTSKPLRVADTTMPFIAPLPVDIDTKSVTVCFNRAFLLKATVCGHNSSQRMDSLESVFIAAAVVFYNVALFFHHHHADSGDDVPYHHHQQQRHKALLLNQSIVEKYYGAADRVLREYMKRTCCPLWTLQAAIWYNMADCTRLQAVTPASCRYFGQLETILKYLPDQDDRHFFKSAISVARIQMNHCYCAIVA